MTAVPDRARASTAPELKARLAAERRGVPFLVYRDSDDDQVIVRLSGRQMTIGRREDNDIALVWDTQVSRLHAQIERIKGDWCVVDEGLSRNGTYVNSQRIAGRKRLTDGDRLCFGATLMIYRAPGSVQSESTQGPGGPTEAVHLSEAQRKVLVALSRPLGESAFATPATNGAIAAELCLSVDAVKAHLRVLFERFGLSDLPQNEKRATLAATALVNGIVAPHEL